MASGKSVKGRQACGATYEEQTAMASSNTAEMKDCSKQIMSVIRRSTIPVIQGTSKMKCLLSNYYNRPNFVKAIF